MSGLLPIQLKLLLFGTPGSGKSTFTGSGCGDPRLGTVAFIDYEGNTAPIASKMSPFTMEEWASKDWKPDPKKLNSIRFTKFGQINAFLNQLLDEIDKNGKSKFDTVVLDSLGALTVKKYDVELDKAKKKYGESEWRKGSYDIYGNVSTEIRQIIEEFIDTGLNLIITCHSKEEKDEQTGLIKVCPELTGMLKTGIPGRMNLSGLIMSTKDPYTRKMCVQQTNQVDCVKDTFEETQLGAEIQWKKGEPIFPMVLDRIGFPVEKSK